MSLYSPPQEREASTMFLKSERPSHNSLCWKTPRYAPSPLPSPTYTYTSGMGSKELSCFQAPWGSLNWVLPLEGLRLIEDRSWVRDVEVAGPERDCWGNSPSLGRWRRSRQGTAARESRLDLHLIPWSASQPSSPYWRVLIPFLSDLSLTSHPIFCLLNSEFSEMAMISGTQRLKTIF